MKAAPTPAVSAEKKKVPAKRKPKAVEAPQQPVETLTWNMSDDSSSSSSDEQDAMRITSTAKVQSNGPAKLHESIGKDKQHKSVTSSQTAAKLLSQSKKSSSSSSDSDDDFASKPDDSSSKPPPTSKVLASSTNKKKLSTKSRRKSSSSSSESDTDVASKKISISTPVSVPVSTEKPTNQSKSKKNANKSKSITPKPDSSADKALATSTPADTNIGRKNDSIISSTDGNKKSSKVCMFIVQLTSLPCLAFLPMGLSANVVVRSSSIAKGVTRTSRERFDLDSQNFTGTSTPTCFTQSHRI